MRINRRGFIGTFVVHGLVLALLILGGLTFPDPPPEEEGILVNFGIDETGFGAFEPEGDDAGQEEPLPLESIPEKTSVPEETVVEDPSPADQTQDVEEVVVKDKPEPTAEDLKKQQEEEERLRKLEEEERLRRLEEERIRQEQEEERKRLEEEQRRRDEQATRLENMGRTTFGQQGVGENDGSEGVDPGTGTNQGTITGAPDAPVYGEGSGLGNGTTYGLGNRKAVGTIPIPNVQDCNVTSRIVVTVEIQVSQDGQVITATRGTGTFNDACIWEVVIAAAKNTKFAPDENAPFRQKGWIRYTIEP